MDDFTVNEMLEMQNTLQEKYKDKWEPICPNTGKNKLLWMIGEIGEVIDIVKKVGGSKASSDENIRNHLVEELADVLMCYNDVFLCYGITSDELKQAYIAKFTKNMSRWYSSIYRSNDYDGWGNPTVFFLLLPFAQLLTFRTFVRDFAQ